MANYSFKRKCNVYLVTTVNTGLKKYKLEVYPDLSFSQTFEESSSNVKTLHDQDAMFGGAVVNRATPANFSFTVLLRDSAEYSTLIAWLTTKNPERSGSVEALYSSDLYIDTGVDLFKLTKCALERATFTIQKDALITVSLQGTASKLQRVGISGTIIPGTTIAPSGTVVALWPKTSKIELGGIETPNIGGITLEVVNSVEWLNYDTLHKSLNITGPADTMYPEAFLVSSKDLTGTITQYLTNTNNANLQSWSTGSALRIRIGSESAIYFLDINMPAVVYTNRLDVQELFMQIYDFRLNSNAVDLATLFKLTLPIAPTNITLPVISGFTSPSSILTVSTGTWTGSPTSYKYQWKRDGINLNVIYNSYTLTDSDLDAYITCAVTAVNTSSLLGVSVTSAPVGPVQSSFVNITPPVISGNPTVNSILTVSDGTWNATVVNFSYQWKRDGVNLNAISSSYTLTNADINGYITCTVTAISNAGPTAISTSNSVGPVGSIITQSITADNNIMTADTTNVIVENVALRSRFIDVNAEIQIQLDRRNLN